MEFITDHQLLGLSLSPAQETCLRAIYGLPLPSRDYLELWHQCTGREVYPGRPFGEVTVIAGARAGKDSRIAAPIVCYEALFGGHAQHLGKGESGTIPLVAQDQRATRIAFGYIREYLTASPLLASMVEEVREAELRLATRMGILCFPCTAKSVRGWSIPAAVMDELAFFRLEASADTDAEIQAALRRGMVGFPDARLVKISTPYMKSGVLWEDFRRYFGQDSPDVLVWQAPSALMNPAISMERLDREQRVDAQRFAREHLAEFAEDLEAFLPAAWVDDAVVAGRHELPPRDGVEYVGAVDPSGGGADAFTLAVIHLDGEGSQARVIQDVMRGWGRTGNQAPDLSGVVREIAVILARYGVQEVRGDRYAGQWVRQAFQEAGLAYREAEMDKSRLYLELEPLFAQGRIELLDHPQLIRELKTLERRPRTGGKTLVDHPHGAHDDHANALALAAASAASASGPQVWVFNEQDVMRADAEREEPVATFDEILEHERGAGPWNRPGVWRF